MNYHAYSYDIAHLEHLARVRSGELRGQRRLRRKRAAPAAAANPTSS